MKKRYKILLWIPILLFFILSSSIFFVFNTYFWKRPIVNYINNKALNNKGLQIKITDLEGNLFSNISLEKISLQTLKKFPILSADKITISYKLSTIFNPKPEILGIEIDGGMFSFPNSIDTLNYHLNSPTKKVKINENQSMPQMEKEPKVWAFDFGITDFTFYYEKRPILIPSLFGNFQMIKDDLTINIDTSTVVIDPKFEKLLLSDIVIHNSKSGFSIKNLNVTNYDAHLMANFKFPKDSAKVIDFSINNINPNNYLPQYKREFVETDSMNFAGIFILDDYPNLDMEFFGQLKGNPIENGKLKLDIHDKLFDVPIFTFTSQCEEVLFNFESKSNNNHNGSISITEINLEKWNVVTSPTHLTGKSNFEINGELYKPDRVIAELNFNETGYDTLNINQITGKVEYANNKLTIVKDILCKVDSTTLSITGISDMQSQQLGLNCKINSPDISIFSPILKNQPIHGEIKGDLSISGDFHNPDIHGDIAADSIGIPEIQFAETKMKFGLLNVAKNRVGSLVLNAKEGTTKYINESIPVLNLDITFKDDTTNIRMLNISGDIFNASAKGKIVNFRDISIDSVDVILKNNHFYNATPINLSVDGNNISLDNTQLKINESDLKITSNVENGQLTFANCEINEFDLASLNDFLPQKDTLSGICNGIFAYNSSVDSQKIDINIDGQHLIYREDHFNSFHAEMMLLNDKIFVPELSLSDSTNGSLMAHGFFTCNFPMEEGETFVDSTNEVDMRVDFSNFDLAILNTYILYNTKLGGNLIGDISLRNSINEPDIETNLYILQPIFDKINLKTIRVNAKSDDKNVNISNMYFTDVAGSYYGEGTIPLDVALLNGVFTIDTTRQMEIDFFSEINSIPALPQYIEEIQSFTGNMLMTMRLRGKPTELKSNGTVDIKDGQLMLTDLENPIFDLNGKIDFNDNIIQMENLTGKLKQERYTGLKTSFAKLMEKVFLKKIIDPNRPNVGITGTIDLNEISKPDINLKMIAKDAYIRTPLGEQEGVADLKIDINGKDSLFVNGDILLKNFTVRNELVATAETFQEPNPDAMHTELSLKVTSPGNFFISNSQLDCELEGEAWLLKSGAEDLRISGDFDVIDGSLYFYQWIFKDLSGNIMFKPDELNPTLNLQAVVDLSGFTDNSETSTVQQTDTEDNLVTIYLTGDLEKPDIQFESTSGQYDQSSILRLLTGTDDQALSDMQSNAEDLGVGMVSRILERQLERSLTNITGMSEFQVKNDVKDIREVKVEELSFSMGRRITTNLYVTFDRDYDIYDQDATNSVGLRYRFDKKKSLSGQINNNGLFEIKYRFRQHY